MSFLITGGCGAATVRDWSADPIGASAFEAIAPELLTAPVEAGCEASLTALVVAAVEELFVPMARTVPVEFGTPAGAGTGTEAANDEADEVAPDGGTATVVGRTTGAAGLLPVQTRDPYLVQAA